MNRDALILNIKMILGLKCLECFCAVTSPVYHKTDHNLLQSIRSTVHVEYGLRPHRRRVDSQPTMQDEHFMPGMQLSLYNVRTSYINAIIVFLMIQ